MENKWIELTAELLESYPDWLRKPLWIALKTGGVVNGSYDWAHGRNCGLFECCGSVYTVRQISHVMPISAPSHPDSEGARNYLRNRSEP